MKELLVLPTQTIAKIAANPVVAVIGIGFVSIRLMESFSSQYDVLGFDVSEKQIKEVRGLTRELLGPIAHSRGLFAGMSPERIDPGRIEPRMRSIPKVVSGLDNVVPGSLEAITRLYSRVFNHIMSVSKPEVAEITKLYKNCQHMMCIAYVNEMADACIGLGIDLFEVYKVAATKPFGYMAFDPSLGVGGHCIPVNLYYLLSNSEFPLLEAAAERMNTRPARIAT
ncbi:Fc.00g105550.m01.CDS01 [Cosmosporella sp. VM-42]